MSHANHRLNCPGPMANFDRRSLLAGGLGGLLSLAIPRWQALAAADSARKQGKSCILLWMNGGPSHIDTFDPKPGTKVGGSFKAVATKIPGVMISEHMPLLAEQADRLAIIRSMSSKEGNHDRGQYLMHTGYAPSATLKHPSLGAWVSHELGDPRFELPNFVSIRGPSISAGFMGAEFNPFAVLHPREGVRNLPLAKDVDQPRFTSRLEALSILQDNFHAESGSSSIGVHDTVYQKAVRLMRSPLVKAFDVSTEPAERAQSLWRRRIRPGLPDGPAADRIGRQVRRSDARWLGHARRQLYGRQEPDWGISIRPWRRS